MFKHRLIRLLATACLGLALCAVAPHARAQQLIIKGMWGMMAGTQPPPGVYAGMFGSINWSDEIRGPNGNAVKGPNFTEEIFGPLVSYVSNLKILGGNYGAVVSLPFANSRLDFPRLD